MSLIQRFNETIRTANNELQLCWSHLTYCIPKTGTLILNDVCGTATSNSFTAIMGPSGSGKTTLLESIAQKIKIVNGAVTLNRVLLTNDIMSEISGFLYQNAFTKDSLTALEYMQFMAAMKLSASMNKNERSKRIEQLFDEFNLNSCWNTRVSNLSGGERRRLFLAAELLLDPLIIFCDEPTTGLDSYNAAEVIKTLKRISMKGKIVIISVHQTSSEIIEYFSHFVLLSQGSAILSGTNEEISLFFKSIHLDCPDSFNSAEYYVKQISIIPGEELECIDHVKFLREKFLESHTWDDLTIHSERIKFKTKLKCSLMRQLIWLVWREYLDGKRNIYSSLSMLFVLMSIAILYALVFSSYQTSSNDVQNMSGLLYLIVSELLFSSSYSVLYTFPYDIPLFLREQHLYSTSMYYIAKIVAKIPLTIFYPFVFLLIIFSSGKLSTDLQLFTNISIVLSVASFASSAWGFMLSGLFETHERMSLLKVPLDMVFILTSGIFLHLQSMSFVIAWVRFISPFFYGNELISILYWTNHINTDCTTNVNCFANGTDILKLKGFNENNYSFDICALIIMIFVTLFIGYVGVWYRKRQSTTTALIH